MYICNSNTSPIRNDLPLAMRRRNPSPVAIFKVLDQRRVDYFSSSRLPLNSQHQCHPRGRLPLNTNVTREVYSLTSMSPTVPTLQKCSIGDGSTTPQVAAYYSTPMSPVAPSGS